MSCRRIRFLIHACVDDEATAAERAAVERHTARCAACAAEREATRRLVRALGDAPERRVSPAFETRLAAALRSIAPGSAPAAWWERFRLRFEWRLRVPAMIAAGSLAAAVIVGAVTPHLAAPGARGIDDYTRAEIVSDALRQHERLGRADARVNWDAVDASIELSTGSLITE